jgi:hypothetical protein
MVLFEALLYVERWLQGKGTSKAKAKALGRNQPFEDKGSWKAKTFELFEAKGSSKAEALRRQRLFESKGKGPSKAKAKALRRQRPLECKSPSKANA